MTQNSSQTARASAVAAALAPHPWRELRALMLARHCVAAVDRHSLLTLLGEVDGTVIGTCHPLEPADPADDRVVAVAELLDRVRWRSFTVDAVSRHVVEAIDSWAAQRDALDRDLHRLLKDL